MSEAPSLESRLLRILAGIAAVAVVGVLAIVPYRLYERDIRHAKLDAHRIARVVHVALADALLRGEDTTDLVNRLQGTGDFEIQLTKLASGEQPLAEVGRASSVVSGTELTYRAPPTLDPQGNAWVSELHFDLAPMRRDSMAIIIDLVLAVVLGSLLFSLTIYVVIRTFLLRPIRRVTRRVARLEDSDEPVQLPTFRTREMQELARTLERVCQARHAG